MTVEVNWDAEARDFALALGAPLDEGRDHLILAFLDQGDPQPLIHFLKDGHELGPEVRHYLALMLDDGDQTSFPPFQLVIDRRRNQRRRKTFPVTAANQLRDGKAAMRVAELRKIGYEKAIEQVASE